MAKQVTNKDLFDADIFSKTSNDVVTLINELDQLETKIISVAKTQKKILNKEDNKTIQSVQRTKTAITELGKAEKLNNDVLKEKIRLEDNIKKSRKVSQLENEQLKVILAEQRKVNRDLAKEKLNLVGAYTKESKKLTELRKKYKDLAVSEGVTSEKSRKLLGDITRLDAKLKQIDRTVGQSQRNVGNYGSAWGRVGATLKSGLGLLGIGSAIAVIGRVVGGAVRTIREFDESVADLQKVTGLAKEDARELAEEIIQIDTRTSVKSLLELASAGGRLGLRGRELVEFTRATDKAFVALGDSLSGSAEEIGLSLGKIASNFGIEQEFGIGEAINKVGSSLNELGANSKATEGKILDFTTRLSGIASQGGLAVPEVQALGALFDEAGVSSEVASSVIAKFLPAIGKDVEKFAKVAGVDVKSFSKLLAEKPIEALQLVSKGAKSSTKGLEGLNKTLENFGIKGGRGAAVVGILATKQERLNELLLISNEAFEDATSLSDEFAVKNETLNARIEKLGNNWDKFIISVENGEGLLSDLFNGAIKGANNLLVSLTRVDKGLKQLSKRSIGAREQFLKSVEEFGLGFDGIGTQLARVDKPVDEVTDRIAKKFKVASEESQRAIVKTLLERIKADKKNLEEGAGLEQLAVEKRINSNLLLLSKLRDIRVATKGLNDEEIEEGDAKIKQVKEIIGLINIQAKVVSDLGVKLGEATSEELIFKIGIEIENEKGELERLKRIASSTIEEIIKIEDNLIDNQIQRRITKEKRKNEKLRQLALTNSRISKQEALDLVAEIDKAERAFIKDLQIKEQQAVIKAESDLAKAKFEQRKTGFKTEEAFEKEKTAQFKAIQRNALNDEIKLLEGQGREKDKLRIEQLKAQREQLNDLGKEQEKFSISFSDIIDVIADEIDKSFEKRIEKIGELLEKTVERIDVLRNKASEGQLEANESLAFEQKKEAELERERERTRKRQARAKAFFSVLTAFEKNDGNLGKTITDIATLKALASGFTAYDGVDDTGGRGNIDSKGGKLWTLHPNEQVWSKKDRGEVGFRNREEIKDIIKFYDNGSMNDLMKHDKSNDFVNPSAFMLNGMSTLNIESKLDDLNRTMQNIKLPEKDFSFDELKGIIKMREKVGNKSRITISKLRG